MRRKLLLLTILLLPFLPVRIQAEGSDRDDITSDHGSRD
ncbi:hypothetical protein HMPREF9022_04962, partial [Erysipelotrichaceae bacterium 2_2_44A]